MPHESSDDVVHAAREQRRKQLEDCARQAAKKILAKLKGSRPSEAALADLIVSEFAELIR